MGLFKQRGIKFVAAICPECNGHLELDAKMETAFCQYCGAQCIVERAVEKYKGQHSDKGIFNSVIDFVERQQNLRRKDRVEREKREEEKRKAKAEEERKEQERIKKYWWVLVLVLTVCFALIGLGILFEGKNEALNTERCGYYIPNEN